MFLCFSLMQACMADKCNHFVCECERDARLFYPLYPRLSAPHIILLRKVLKKR